MRKKTVVCLALVLFGMMFLFQPVSGAQGMRGGMMGGGYGMMGPAWGRGAWMGPGWAGYGYPGYGNPGYGNPGYGYPGYGYNPAHGQTAPHSGALRQPEGTAELREKIDKKLREVESLMGQEKPEKEKILSAHRELLDLQVQLEQKALQHRLENPPQPATAPMAYGGYGGYPGWAGGPGWLPPGFGLGCPCDSWGYNNPALWGLSPYGGGYEQHWQHQQQPAAPGMESR